VAAAMAAVAAVCAVASLVFVAVSVKDAGSLRRTELWGWTKDSIESGDGKISAEEVEQLNSILDAQDNLKKNLKTMAEKLDKGRGTEIAVEQGNNSPAGPDGERGAQGPKGPPGPTGVVGPQGALGKEGAMGLKGAQGGVGSPGKRGPGGEQGGIGSFGLEGPKGNMGAVGYAGAPGAPGPQGSEGAQQPNLAGPVGPMGPVGPPGPNGPNGARGPRGPPGDDDVDPPSPDPNPPTPTPVEEEAMPAGATGLNYECSKWRDNNAGTGNKPDLSLNNQKKQMAYCMAQDCQQSMEAVSCRYTDPNRLCYSSEGQLFCSANPGHSACQDLGAEVTGTNVDGPGTWEPMVSVPVFGSAASEAPGPYQCVCLKNCAHYTGSSTLKKYRCTGGTAIKTGAVAGSRADVAEISDSTKTGQCACSCGYTDNADSWEAQDAQ